MTTLILLLCSLLPLAVMVVAAVKGFRRRSSTVLSLLIASALVLSASVLASLMLEEEPSPSIKFSHSHADRTR